jgi:dipeptidyl aminopeptidase/acylaminoacyl peptidase
MLLGYEPQTPYVEMNPDLIADVSPITHISKDDAPALLCHGNDDPVVPIQHAKRMEQAMKRAGLDCRLVAVDNVGHGPGRDEEVKKATMEFFTKYLLDAKSAGVILKSGARR